VPDRQVRAVFSESAITVYQAYPVQIAERAVAAGTFVAPFKVDRMTWVKPSFLWMMYRSGWARKEGQERVLAVEISRDGFEWALSRAALSHYEPGTYDSRECWAAVRDASPVRVQWDPERSLTLAPLGHRAVQVGLSGEAVTRYLDQWISGITDVTSLARRVHAALAAGDTGAAVALLPAERPYPLPAAIRARIGAS